MQESYKKGVIALLILLIALSIVETFAIINLPDSPAQVKAPEPALEKRDITTTGKIELTVQKPTVTTSTGQIILNVEKR